MMAKKDKRKKIYFACPWEKMNSVGYKDIVDILSQFFIVVTAYDNEQKHEEKYGSRYYDIALSLNTMQDKRYFDSINVMEDFARDIVATDYQLVSNCDAFLAWYPSELSRPSIGPVWEHTWAYKLHKRPIFTICETLNPFAIHFSSAAFTDIDTFARLITAVIEKDAYYKPFRNY